MHMIRSILATILIPLTAMMSGCLNPSSDDDGPSGVPNIQNTYSYWLGVPAAGTGIWTEYDTYKFLPSEVRDIYAYGRMPNSSYETVTCYDQNNNSTGSWTIRVGANAYYDNVNLLFTGPVVVRAPYSIGMYTYRVVLSSMLAEKSADFKVQVISKRDYPLEYSCQADQTESYDLQNQGYNFGYGDFSTPIQVAYGDCNTKIVKGNSSDRGISVYNTQLPVEVLHNISAVGLKQYGQTYASDGENHDASIVVLFAVKDYDDRNYPKDRGGYPIGKAVEFGTSPATAFSFVFMKTIDDGYSSYLPDERKVLKTSVAIHELGHARRKESPLDDTFEQYVHNGMKKDKCVMNIWPMSVKPDKAFYFCEGHKQAYLNISW